MDAIKKWRSLAIAARKYLALHLNMLSVVKSFEVTHMVEVSAEAVNFINDLLQKNDKAGYGIRIYLAGMGCSGPQFGMAFQETVKEGDHEQKSNGFSFFFDGETAEMLEGSTVDYIETPAGSGLIVNNPNVKSSCGGSCAGCH